MKNFPDDFAYVPGIAGGVGGGHGRRIRPVHRQARPGQRAHRCGDGKRDGQPGSGVRQRSADRHGRSADPRNGVVRAISDQQGRNCFSAAVGEVGRTTPKRAEDVPAAFMRAYTVALQPPAGPVFLSIPLDNWEKPALGPAVIRTASHRVSPDAARLRTFAEQINAAKRLALVFGPEVDRSGAWDAGVAFAEKVGAPVYAGPLPDQGIVPRGSPAVPGTAADDDRRCHRGAARP